MRQADVAACAKQLRLVVDEIDAGRLDASPVQIAYVRGALEALEAQDSPARFVTGRGVRTR